MLVNLTPEVLRIRAANGFTDILPMGQLAGVQRAVRSLGEVEGVPLVLPQFGVVHGLPSPQEDTVYVVSAPVAQACAIEGYRIDVVAVDEDTACRLMDMGRVVVQVRRFISLVDPDETADTRYTVADDTVIKLVPPPVYRADPVHIRQRPASSMLCP